MVKIQKYSLKSRKRGSGLNRKQRREISRTLPRLQAVVRSRLARTSPTPHAKVLSSMRTRTRRGRRRRKKKYLDSRHPVSFPTLFQPINPYIPVLQPIPVSIPAVQPPALDSEKGKTIIIDGPNEKTYELYIDADGLVTVVKEGNSQDQIEGTNAQE